jgi:hypothetical protein
MNDGLPRFEDSPSSRMSAVADRRRDPRFPTCAHVEIELQNPVVQRMKGIVRDVSASGLRLEVQAAVTVGTPVRISLDHIVIHGEIRHCHPSGTGFNVGVLVHDVDGPQEQDYGEIDDGELDIYAILVQVVLLAKRASLSPSIASKSSLDPAAG